MKTLVIIPSYNEELNIVHLVNKVKELSYDFVVINDCSTDRTKQLLYENHINHLDLPCNIGLANVTQMGFKYAVENGYTSAIVIDGDGQHDPTYIKDLFEKIEEGYDYVIGSRYLQKKKPWTMRMVGSRIISFFIKIKTGKSIHDPTSGMRCLGEKVLNEFADYMNFVAEPDAVAHIIHQKYKVTEVQVDMDDREQGDSYFKNPFKSLQFMIKVLISILFIQ